MSLKYRSLNSYKYQLEGDYGIRISIKTKELIMTEFIQLDPDGVLIIKKFYAWDGPSGPAIDTKNFMRGSLVHDVLYQLLRDGYLNQSLRMEADKILKQICIEDGMSRLRAWWVYHGVRWGGASAARLEK